MALTVINTPTKTNGATQSNWVACHNPVVFKIQTDAIPNTRDLSDSYISVSNISGKAVFTLDSTSNAEWYTPFLSVDLNGFVYNGIAVVERYDPSTFQVYTNLPYVSDDNGTVTKYYDGYLIDVLPTIGLPSSHTWFQQKPEAEGTIQSIAPLNGVSVFDLQVQIQQNVSSENDLKQPSFPNDLNAFTGFKLSYRESFIDSVGDNTESILIAGYGDLSGFALLTVSSINGIQTGSYIRLSGFDNDEYNNAVVRIRQIISSTTIQVDIQYNPYLSLSGYEQLNGYDISLDRFESDFIEEGQQWWGVNAKQALGSFFGSNLVEYLASGSLTLARFMTVFEERNVFPDQYEDFTVLVGNEILSNLVGDNVLAYRQTELDKNGLELTSNVVVVQNQSEGVYRLPSGGNPSLQVQGLSFEYVPSGIKLTWDALTDIPLFSGYEIWRSDTPDVFTNGSLLATSASEQYTDLSVVSPNEYYYAVRAIGTFASDFSNELLVPYFAFNIRTDHNTAIDGAYSPFIIGGTKTWLIGNDVIVGDNPNYTGTFLNGTIREITVLFDNPSLVNLFNFSGFPLLGDSFNFFIFNGVKSGTSIFEFNSDTLIELTGFKGVWSGITTSNLGSSRVNYDFSTTQFVNSGLVLDSLNSIISPLIPQNVNTLRFTGIYTGASLNLSGFIINSRFALTATSALVDLNLNPSAQTINNVSFLLFNASGLVNVDISQFTVDAQLNLQGTGDGGSFSVGGGNYTRLSFFGNGFTSVDFGAGNIGDHTVDVNFRNSGYSTAEVDALYIELDRIALALSVPGSCSINTNGNSAPSATSLVARNSLIAKGYLIIL